MIVTVLLGALATAGAIVGIAVARSISPPDRLYVPPPVITSGPTSPTRSRSATLVYTDALRLVKFQCSLDGSSFVDCGVTRPSSISYYGLSEGVHTFQVRAVAGLLVSPPTRWTWRIDVTPPQVQSITRADPSPTNAATVHWTVMFTEAVTGIASDGGNFSFAAAGLTGSPAVTGVTGDGSTYTVTASTGTGTAGPTGSLRLDLTIAGQIEDLAGNGVIGVPFSGATYTIDKTPPPPGWSITGAPLDGVILYPGGGDAPLNLTFSNPGSSPLQITSVTTTITGTSSSACPSSNFTIGQQLVGSVTVPANSVVSLEQLGVPQASWPQLRMLDTQADQDACQNATVDLSFSGQGR